jgi:phage terminase small subunit
MSERGLTPKQARFVEEYLVDLNATQAAVRAGYSERTADKQGSQLLGKPRIALAIAAAQSQRSEKTQVTLEYVIGRLVENVERSMQVEPVLDKHGRETGEYQYAGAVANKALELLGKHLGAFSESLNLRTPDGPVEVIVTRRVIGPDAAP